MLKTLEGRKRIMPSVAPDKERATFHLSSKLYHRVFVTSSGPCVNWERSDSDRNGFNLWTKYRRQRKRKRYIFCNSLVLIEYLRIKRFEDCSEVIFKSFNGWLLCDLFSRNFSGKFSVEEESLVHVFIARLFL